MSENYCAPTNEQNAINAAVAYSRGIVCPAEMWRALFEELPDERPLDFLNNLPDEIWATYRRAIEERPDSFERVALAGPSGDAVRSWLLKRRTP